MNEWDLWREWLYPLGFLSMLIFMARFIFQWLSSEREGRCLVTPLFWNLSILGNGLLFIHALIQNQPHVACVQSVQAVFAARNLNLMREESCRWSFRLVLLFLVTTLSMTAALFSLQHLFLGVSELISVPKMPWNSSSVNVSLAWHLFGTVGIVLFFMRFFVQWVQAEWSLESRLTAPFWWLSFLGSLISLIYFVRLGDLVNFIGPIFGLVPYVRNLLLIRREALVHEA